MLSMTAGCDGFYSIILPLQPKVIPNAICGICQKGKEANKKGKPEALIHCSQCDNSGKFTLLILKDNVLILFSFFATFNASYVHFCVYFPPRDRMINISINYESVVPLTHLTSLNTNC